MFHIRLQAKYGEQMSDSDIKSARIITVNAEKLATTAYHVRHFNLLALHKDCPNFHRAAKNILRISALIEDAYWEIESLHDAYTAQYFGFDDDEPRLPDFDFSEQSILETKATDFWLEADLYLTYAVCDYATAKGYYEDFIEAYDALRNVAMRDKFIRDYVITEKSSTIHAA